MLTRRNFLKACGVSAAALALPGLSRAAAGRKPNIILIVADDLGWGDLGCYGQKDIKTPNLDRMAAEGVRFTDFYAGNTVCAPSRCALMTGRDMGHAWVRGNANQSLRPEDVTIAMALKEAGYATGLIGKWGLGEEGTDGVPSKKGWDFFFGYLNQRHAHNFYTDYLFRNGERIKLDNEQTEKENVAKTKNVWSHDLIAKEGLDFIERSKDGPFFLFGAYTLPHANNEGARATGNGEEIPSYGEYANAPWPECEKGRAAMITRLDKDVGDIFAKLKALGLDEDTIVLFSSDNGPHKEGGEGCDPELHNDNGPLRGIKRDLYEGGIRVPMIVRWPGKVKPGTTSKHQWAFWDFPPTAAELAGTKFPGDIQGISMVPAILGQPDAPKHEYLYWEFYEGGFKQAARVGDWKAVRKGLEGPIELYDLSKDIGETSDVAAEHADVVAKMKEIFKTAREDNEKWNMALAKTKAGGGKKTGAGGGESEGKAKAKAENAGKNGKVKKAGKNKAGKGKKKAAAQ